ncbi:MAG TPA: class I fructose-bisphosphate aldolase, partial [Armatimonadota bacterium]
IPSEHCIAANALSLALYAALSQEADLVPIVEPEVLMDGDHDIEACREATERVLAKVFLLLNEQRVFLEGTILKVNMILPGKESQNQVSVQEAAEHTVNSMRRVVPPALPGIMFLSGGQEAIAATERLNAINSLPRQPWELSFSFARGLQEPAMKAWKGNPENIRAAQEILHHRAKCEGAARFGKYCAELESEKQRQKAA